jgi:hypothetical protein
VCDGASGGTCVITASQAETAVYSATTSNTVSVSVKERTTTFSYPQISVTVGQALTLTPITSGLTNPTFALIYGNLPAGLTLNTKTGVISGTPTGVPGTFNFVISVFQNNAYDVALVVIAVQDVPAAISQRRRPLPRCGHVRRRNAPGFGGSNLGLQRWRKSALQMGRNGEISVGNLCLDIEGANPNDGGKMIVWQCFGARNQRWRVKGRDIVSELSGKCLAVWEGRARNVQRVVTWGCNGSTNQQWW